MGTEHPDGATPLEPDEKERLRLSHITTREELNIWEHRNILEAHRWLSRKRGPAELDENFLRTLHRKMFGKVWDWAGNYRRSNKNIGIDWPQIPVALRELLDDLAYWKEHESFRPDKIVVCFHHRLVYIHAFPNGNGRHARLVSDHILERWWGLSPFSWGSGNLDGPGEVRKRYIRALRAADNHDYGFLEDFVRS